MKSPRVRRQLLSSDDLPPTIGDHPRQTVVFRRGRRSVVGDLARLGAGDGQGDRGGVYPARRLVETDAARTVASHPDSAHWSRMHLTASSPPVESVDVPPKVVRQRGFLTLLSRQAPSLASSGSWDAGSVVSVGASP